MEITRLKLAFLALAALIAAAWLLSVEPAALAAGFWPLRRLLIPFTGALAIGFMAVAVLLAARPAQVESALGGLDKFYRLHKWLGVAGPLVGIAHWLLAIVPPALARHGWLERAPRRLGPGGGGPNPFRGLREPAAELGEWGLYLLLILVGLALSKRFPYHLFFKTHRLMAPLFLALTFHSVVLAPAAYWRAPIGVLLALLLAGGATAAGLSLFRRIGQSRRAVGEVVGFHLHPGNSVLDVKVRLATAWPGHAAGQFAFLDFEDAEAAHPFTISSAWRGDGRMDFSIKGLGDYTRKAPRTVRVGLAVTVEGPYGRFDFRGAPGARQLWVAGGVGITPFVARLQALAEHPGSGPADLIYCTAAPDAGFIGEVRTLAARAGVPLHLVEFQQEGFLTLDKLAARVPRWREGDVWFCGPDAFGRSLGEAMAAAGLPANRFHRELFDMR